jgi:hypothetical protein
LSAPLLRFHLLENRPAAEIAQLGKHISRGVDASEYRTRWTTRPGEIIDPEIFADMIAAVPVVAVISGDGKVEIITTAVTSLTVEVMAKTAVQLRFRRFYYPGWKLTRQSIDASDQIPIAYRASKELGFLEATIPRGTHRLILQRIPITQERIGAVISLIAALLLLAVFFSKQRRPSPQPTPPQ